MGFDTTSERLQDSNILDNVYATYVILGGELFSAEIRAAVGNNYGKLQFAFNKFQNIMNIKLSNNKKCLQTTSYSNSFQDPLVLCKFLLHSSLLKQTNKFYNLRS